MTISISFSELQEIIKAKTGKKVLFKTINDRTIAIGYELKARIPVIGTISKTVWLNITVLELQDEDLHLAYDTGREGDLFIRILLTVIPTSKYSNYVDLGKNRHIIVHLANEEQVHQTLQKVRVNCIKFQGTAAIIAFRLLTESL